MNSNTGDEGCQPIFESPKFMMFPCLWAVMSTQKENGELKIVAIPGILCSWLASREKEFVFGLYILQIHDWECEPQPAREYCFHFIAVQSF